MSQFVVSPAMVTPPLEASQPEQPVSRQRRIQVETNAYGATFYLREQGTDRELEKKELSGDAMLASLTIPARTNVVVEAVVGGKKVSESVAADDERTDLNLKFDDKDIRALCKKATALIRIPDGGHGSGFICGDRHTLVTAAHVVVCKRAEDLEIVFDADATEKVFRGGHLIYYSPEKDVAVLQFDEPFPPDRPYLWPLNEARGREILIIGNPASGNAIQYLEVRKSHIGVTRPDEFTLNEVEAHPGNSGGPVTDVNSTGVYGLVSYKIVGPAGGEVADYRSIGFSFAKSIRIARDAWENYLSSEEEARLKRKNDLSARFAKMYAYRAADQAAAIINNDSVIYTIICHEIAVDYIRYMNEARAKVVNVRQYDAALKKADKEYFKERAPTLAKRVRDRVSPKLQKNAQKWVDVALQDPELPSDLREKIAAALKSYKLLRKAAEQIVPDPELKEAQGGAGALAGVAAKSPLIPKGKSVDEFVTWVREQMTEAHDHATDVHDACVREMH